MSTPTPIAIIGYGKMGKAIDALAEKHQVQVVATFSSANTLTAEKLKESGAAVAIEFSLPKLAKTHIEICLESGVPVAIGTTGWLEHWKTLNDLCTKKSGSMLYASNFSIGVNVFFAINRKLAQLMQGFPEYAVEMEEVHHTQKLDAPSGTAITLAEGISDEIADLKGWKLKDEMEPEDSDVVPITAKREEDVKGIHAVTYTSENDKIEIYHEAFNRNGFASGALMAAKFLAHQKPGIYTMEDVFNSL